MVDQILSTCINIFEHESTMIDSTSRAGLGPLIGQYFGLEHTLGIWKFGIAPLEKEGSPTIHFELCILASIMYLSYL